MARTLVQAECLRRIPVCRANALLNCLHHGEFQLSSSLDTSVDHLRSNIECGPPSFELEAALR